MFLLLVSRARWALPPLLLASLAGCSTVPADWGRAEVAAATAERGRPLPAGSASSLAEPLLDAPLTADGAVTVALLHNPDFRATAA